MPRRPRPPAELSSSQERLKTALEAPEHAALKDYLEECTRTFRRQADVTFSPSPSASSKLWRPDSNFVVLEEPLEVSGNLILGHDSGGPSRLICLQGLRAANVLCMPDSEVYIGGPCSVPGLLYAAMPDATFVVLGELSAGVVYSGHGDGWVTAMGPTNIEILDDYVEGADDDTDVEGKRPDAPAADVLPELASDDGELDRERTLEAFLDGGFDWILD